MKRFAGLLLAVLMICCMIPFASVTVAADDIVKDEPEGIVEIKGEDTPPIEVEGLKEVLEDNEAVITEEDKEKIENGQISVEVVFEAEEKSKKEAVGADAMSRLAEKAGLTMDLFLDLSLLKVTTQLTGDRAGESTANDVGSVNKNVLEIAIPYDTSKINIGAFRCHNGITSALTSLAEKPTDDLVDGTFYVGDGYVYIYGSGFSTYGLGGLDDRLDGPAAPSGLTPTAPSSKGGNDGTIGGVITDMEYSVDNGKNWIPVTETPITGLTPGKVLVRVAGTDTVKPGASAEVTVPDYSGTPGKADGPAAPDVTPVAPTSENGTDGKVAGVNETMEYSTDGGTTWKPVVGTSVTGFISGTNVTVRVKETETTKAGASKVVVIPDFVKADGPAAPNGLSATAPTSKNGTDGKVLGADATMEYSADGGETWKPVTGIEIGGLAGKAEVKVRVKETDTAKAGTAATISVPDYADNNPGKADGPAAPTGVGTTAPTSKDGTDGKVLGVDTTMEYSIDSGATWKPVTGTEITGLAGTTNVTVRVKETDITNAGAAVTVVVSEFVKADGPAAPSGLSAAAPTSKNGTDGKVLGADATMEYSTDGGATWKPVTATEITGLSAGDVKVRVKETDSTKAGAIATVTVPEYIALGSVLSEGNWWIIIVVAVLALGGVAALVIVKKKKKAKNHS